MRRSPSGLPSFSLRRRLLGFLVVPLLLLLGASVLSDYREGLNIADTAYDYALFNTAQAVAAQLDLDPDVPSKAEAVIRAEAVDQVFFAVIDSTGVLIAGDKQLASIAIPVGLANPTYRFATLGDLSVRVVTYRHRPLAKMSKPLTILVAETTHKREIAATQIMLTTLRIDGLLIALSMIIVFFGIQYALKPLETLSQRMQHRDVDDLRPLSEEGAPIEAWSLVSAINRLLDNLRQAGVAQQTFISNAAHQLRTPLAGLQTQLELASENLTGQPLLRMKVIQESTKRLAHLTTQMLALARSSAEANPADEMQAVALDELLETSASDFIDVALGRNIDLGFEIKPVATSGFRWMLKELLANLIDNAIRYTPENGCVTVRCGLTADGIPFLEVEDDGPGIPVETYDRVFDRFVRLDDRSVEGSGLGLAIVKEVAIRHRASLSLQKANRKSGLLVRVGFPCSCEVSAASVLAK